MRIVPIAEIPKLMHDEVVPSIKGKLRKVHKQHKGEGQYGAWSLQNLELEAIAPDTGVAKIVLKDQAEMAMNMQGRVIYISCHTGEKGMTGIKVKDKEHKTTKKMEREVSVTPTALIEWPDGQPQPSNQQEKSQPARQPEPEPSHETEQEQPRTQAPAKATDAVSAEKTALVEIGKKSHLHFLCMRAAIYEAKQVMDMTKGEIKLNAEDIRTVATTVYMDCQRQGLHINLSPSYKFEPPKSE